MLLLPLASVSTVAAFSLPRPHPFIRVYAEENPISAPDEHLFLCPKPFIDGMNLTDWPRHEVTINGSECVSSEELLATEDNAMFFECLAETINSTTYVLDSIGIDASISDGTLLGWYRHHKGFIPWDVDGDLSIMKSDCRKSFGEYASPEHKNIASLVQGLMPDYQVYGIKLGVGSALDEDEWEGCENAEFRVYHVVNGTACHVDVFQHLQSTDPEEPCKSCPGHLDGKVTVCRYAEGEVCALRDDFVPMTWDHVSWADCKVPHRPTHTLETQLAGPFEFRNFESIPGNYKYVERILVVGQPVGQRDVALIPYESSITEPPVALVTLPQLRAHYAQGQSYANSFIGYDGAFGAVGWQQSFILVISLGALCSIFLFWIFCHYRPRVASPCYDSGDEDKSSPDWVIQHT